MLVQKLLYLTNIGVLILNLCIYAIPYVPGTIYVIYSYLVYMHDMKLKEKCWFHANLKSKNPIQIN